MPVIRQGRFCCLSNWLTYPIMEAMLKLGKGSLWGL